MLFNSLHFILFFIFVVPLYFIIPTRYRWILLFVASSYFYMAFIPAYVIVLYALILIDYTMGLLIGKTEGKRKRVYFITSIIANIGMLFVFKYFNFFNDNIRALAELINWSYSIESLKLILPIGLSFHTFQSLAYVIEVYKGRQTPERHLGVYAVYVLFFPQLVAGPIERPGHMLPQFHSPHGLDSSRLVSGMELMAWGFFKKVVIADRLGGFVDAVFGNLSDHTGISLLIAIFFYAFQIYCDFSGYSDIAIGSARVLGFDLTVNFNRPFFSKSINEFWRRWHISLSQWFRDYLYYPLAYSKRIVSKTWLYICLLLTFLVSGLWHGAGWTFVAWGGLHGLYLVIGALTKQLRQRLSNLTRLARLPRLHASLQMLITFILACVSWIFFRSENFHEAANFFSGIFKGWSELPARLASHDFVYNHILMGYRPSEFYLAIGAILFLLIVEWRLEKRQTLEQWKTAPIYARSFARAFLLLAIIIFGVFHSRGFIYFQF